MTEASITLGPEFLFSEKAFTTARQAGGIALVHEREELEELVRFINDNSQRAPLPSPEDLAFVAMQPSKVFWRSEKHYYEQDDLFPFIDAEQLGSGQRPHTTTTKADLDEANRHILEYRPWEPVGGMTRWIARRGFGPPPQEAKILASAEAWGNQWKGLSPDQAKAMEDEAVKLFPGAVRIENRPPKRTVG